MANLTPIPVEPIGTEQRPTFINHGDAPHAMKLATVQIFPDSPDGEEFRKRRIVHRVTLADAAQWLGISVSDLSAIEHGEKTLSADEWRTAFRALG